MNHQVKLKRTNRIAEYFVVISSKNTELIAINENEDENFQVNSENYLSLRYEPVVIDRYPLVDRFSATSSNSMCDNTLKLPEGIEYFCLPNGLFLYPIIQKPLFHSFVHTTEDGSRKLGCCLTIYEPLSQAQQESLFTQITTSQFRYREHFSIYNQISSENNNLLTTTEDDLKAKIASLFIPKCLCLISTWPFMTSFKKFLVGIYNISRMTGDEKLCHVVFVVF